MSPMPHDATLRQKDGSGVFLTDDVGKGGTTYLVIWKEIQPPYPMHKYALWGVYLFSFSLSPFDKMKVPLLRCQRGSLTASLSLFEDLNEA